MPPVTRTVPACVTMAPRSRRVTVAATPTVTPAARPTGTGHGTAATTSHAGSAAAGTRARTGGRDRGPEIAALAIAALATGDTASGANPRIGR